jgi:hypothetical protein
METVHIGLIVVIQHVYANNPPTLRDSHPGDPLSLQYKRFASPGSLVVSILPKPMFEAIKKTPPFPFCEGRIRVTIRISYMVPHRHQWFQFYPETPEV